MGAHHTPTVNHSNVLSCESSHNHQLLGSSVHHNVVLYANAVVQALCATKLYQIGTVDVNQSQVQLVQSIILIHHLVLYIDGVGTICPLPISPLID